MGTSLTNVDFNSHPVHYCLKIQCKVIYDKEIGFCLNKVALEFDIMENCLLF